MTQPVRRYTEKFKQLSRFPLRIIFPLFRQAMQILIGLHQRGYIHGDVKAENFVIQLDDNGIPIKIFALDLGWAQRIGSRDYPGIFGTPKFQPPEIFRPRDLSSDTNTISPKMDVYSFGIMTTQLLGAINSFNNNKLLRAAFEKILRRMIADDPRERPSFEELLREPFFEDIFHQEMQLGSRLTPFESGSTSSGSSGSAGAVRIS